MNKLQNFSNNNSNDGFPSMNKDFGNIKLNEDP